MAEGSNSLKVRVGEKYFTSGVSAFDRRSKLIRGNSVKYAHIYLTLPRDMSEKLWAWKLKAWLLSFAWPIYLKLLKAGRGAGYLASLCSTFSLLREQLNESVVFSPLKPLGVFFRWNLFCSPKCKGLISWEMSPRFFESRTHYLKMGCERGDPIHSAAISFILSPSFLHLGRAPEWGSWNKT